MSNGLENEFLYNVFELSSALVILPSDSLEAVEQKKAHGITAESYGESIGASLYKRLNSEISKTRDKRRREYGKAQDGIVEDLRGRLLSRFAFKNLLQLVVIEHSLLKTLQIEERPLRAALYEGAQHEITVIKLGQAQKVLEVEMSSLEAYEARTESVKNPIEHIKSLEDFQAKLIAQVVK